MATTVTRAFISVEVGTLFESEGAIYRKTGTREALLLRNAEGKVRPELVNVGPLLVVKPLAGFGK